MDLPLIMIVDDDANIRELLSVNLKAAGYRVVLAADGAIALHLVKEARPSAIILDIMMPQMDGWELCKLIRDDPDLMAVKIIMLTAKDSQRDKMIGKFILKADAYITKPFEIETLLITIARLLNGL
jgi:DNA-binding response OmpR family regulator